VDTINKDSCEKVRQVWAGLSSDFGKITRREAIPSVEQEVVNVLDRDCAHNGDLALAEQYPLPSFRLSAVVEPVFSQ
jgi:hypothetical protein